MSRLGPLGGNTLTIMGQSLPPASYKVLKPSFPLGTKIKSKNEADTFLHIDNRRASDNFLWDKVAPYPSASHDDGGNHDRSNNDYVLGAYGYGKNNVKILHVRRDDKYSHEIREYEVDTHLRLGTQKDYFEGNNRDIIATDSQKNTVYLLAKKYGVKSPEEFAILLCAHFLYTYSHVEEVHVNVSEYPWARHRVDGVPHNHAFVFSPTAMRYCQVGQIRNESPKIRGGLKNLRVLKTTQSSFTDFIQDEYRTLPDANDRIFSTVVTASWDFSTASGVDFDKVWNIVKDCILKNFAGPPVTGIYSPSVQNTLYLAEKSVLDNVQQIASIEMRMPNKHYYDLDLSKFPKLVEGENKEVYLPVDKPSGIIYAQLHRKDVSPKL